MELPVGSQSKEFVASADLPAAGAGLRESRRLIVK